MTATTLVLDTTGARPATRRAERLSLSQARRIALAAQGLHRPRPAAEPGLRQVTAAVRRLGVLQIDSVNVVARAHLVPLYSRLGPYDVGLLDRLHARAPRRLVEAWAHEASFVPVETWPLLEWRRRSARDHAWGSVAAVPDRHPVELAMVREILAERGPVTAAQVHTELEARGGAPRHANENWGWNWTAAKHVLEYLFFTGEVVAAGRSPQFERRYDLAERALPREVVEAPPLSDAEAIRGLVEISARAHGIATPRDLRDYFRLYRGVTKELLPAAIAELVQEGTLVPVDVVAEAGGPVGRRGGPSAGRADALRGPWLRHRDAALPRRATGTALLSPFDPLVFERSRLEELFGTTYRIEIYVPAAKRQYGYYVLPFLQDERITARVDLKADRQAGVLRVQAAHAEPWSTDSTPERLAAELRTMAGWLGLGDVAVAARGDLAPALAAALAGG